MGLGSQDTFSVITSQEQLMLDLVKTILIVIVQLWTLTHWELLGKGANIESVYLVILINSSHSPFSAPMRNFWWSSNMNNYLLTCRQTIICEIVISRNSAKYNTLFETKKIDYIYFHYSNDLMHRKFITKLYSHCYDFIKNIFWTPGVCTLVL